MDGRKRKWSEERRAAHGARIRAALANKGPKKVGRPRKMRAVSIDSADTLVGLVANYEAAKRALRDHFEREFS